jgi:hypothetical protein
MNYPPRAGHWLLERRVECLSLFRDIAGRKPEKPSAYAPQCCDKALPSPFV